MISKNRTKYRTSSNNNFTFRYAPFHFAYGPSLFYPVWIWGSRLECIKPQDIMTHLHWVWLVTKCQLFYIRTLNWWKRQFKCLGEKEREKCFVGVCSTLLDQTRLSHSLSFSFSLSHSFLIFSFSCLLHLFTTASLSLSLFNFLFLSLSVEVAE